MPIQVTLDQPPAQVAGPTPYHPTLALLFYQQAQGQVEMLKHPVHPGVAGGPPVLGAGGYLSVADQDALLLMLAGAGLRWVNDRTLACGQAQVVWWVPPGKRPLLFDAKYGQTASIARLSGVPVPLPGLVMIAEPGKLRVFALPGSERPGPGTALMHAPFWNIFQAGNVCQGSVKYPQTCTPDDQEAWETVFFQSVFTGPSRSDRYMNWGRSYEELLDTAIAEGAFPERVLVGSGQLLRDVLN